MIILEFWIGNTKYTWFLDNNYLGLFTFLIGILGGTIYRLSRRRRLNRVDKNKNKNKNLRGGEHIGNCLEPSKGYEIINEDLKKTIFEILGLKKFNRNIILPVAANVAILANSVLMKKLGTQLSLSEACAV